MNLLLAVALLILVLALIGAFKVSLWALLIVLFIILLMAMVVSG